MDIELAERLIETNKKYIATMTKSIYFMEVLKSIADRYPYILFECTDRETLREVLGEEI